MMKPRSVATALTVLWASLSPSLLAGEPELARTMPEYRAKAYFLRSFGQYVTWPESAFREADAPFVIGIFGLDPFGEEIDRLVKDYKIDGRRVEVRRLELVEEARECQIVFISLSERHRQAEVLEALKGYGVLTVGESDWFLQLGGGIRLSIVRTENGSARPRFEVHRGALEREGLTASSRMLKLARKVVE